MFQDWVFHWSASDPHLQRLLAPVSAKLDDLAFLDNTLEQWGAQFRLLQRPQGTLKPLLESFEPKPREQRQAARALPTISHIQGMGEHTSMQGDVVDEKMVNAMVIRQVEKAQTYRADVEERQARLLADAVARADKDVEKAIARRDRYAEIITRAEAVGAAS